MSRVIWLLWFALYVGVAVKVSSSPLALLGVTALFLPLWAPVVRWLDR